MVLATASRYFHSMFTHFKEKIQGLVVTRELNSTALQLLVNFIYSGEILVTENNVQVIIDKVLYSYG